MRALFSSVLKSFVVVLVVLIHLGQLQGANFDELKTSFEEKGDQQTVGDVIQLLEVAQKEIRSPEALAVAGPWLQANRGNDSRLWLELARTYDRAGEWVNAVRYYQRYFEQGKLDEKIAMKEIDRMYALSLGLLKDEAGTYAFMSRAGAKLRRFGKAKQYDHWLLKQAHEKKDVNLLIDYLTAVFNDKGSDHSKYEKYMDTLSNILNHDRVLSGEDYARVLQLARLSSAGKWRYRLEWPATIHPYNQKLEALLQSKGKQEAKESDTKAMLAIASKRALESEGWGMYDVTRGFLGAQNGHLVDKRMAVHSELKQNFLLSYFSKLSRDEMAKTLGRSNMREFHGRRDFSWDKILFPATARKLVLKVPHAFNGRDALGAPLLDKAITVEEAKKLAPILRANPRLEAGVVRAFAAAGPSFPKVVEEIWQNEMWRYGRLHEPAKYLWNSGPKRDGDFNKITSAYKSDTKDDPRYTDMLKLVGGDQPFSKRKETFQEVLDDMLGKTPSIRDPMSLLNTVMVNSQQKEVDELLATTIAPTQISSEIFSNLLASLRLKDEKGNRVSPPNHWDGSGRLDHVRWAKLLPETHGKLVATLNDYFSSKKPIPEIYAKVWFNFVRDYRDPEIRKLGQQIFNNPAYSNYYSRFREYFSEYRGRFGQYSFRPPSTQKAEPPLDKELRELSRGALPTEVSKAFSAVINRMKKSGRYGVFDSIRYVSELSELDPKTIANASLYFSELSPASYHSRHGFTRSKYSELIQKLIGKIQEGENWESILSVSTGFWKCTVDNSSTDAQDRLVDFAEAAMEAGKLSLASSLAQQGLSLKVGGDVGRRLQALKGKLEAAMGVAKIPVDRTDPTYPIYNSQAEYLKGNDEAAWSSLMEAPELVPTIVKKLNPDFSFWAIEECLKRGQAPLAKNIGQAIYIWSIREKGSLDTAQEAKLRLAMGDIAFKDGNYVMAKSQYQKVIQARAYQGTPERFSAQLGTIEVDMATKDYSSALQTLEKLIEDPLPERRMKAHYIRAKVHFTQGNYGDAMKDIETILASDSDFKLQAEALILKGDIAVQERNFESSEEIEVGHQDSKTVITPGEPITIKLIDKSLGISGTNPTIEVEVVSKSGDLERLLLRADEDPSIFRARIRSELGAPKQDDKVLQILGEDEITYGYSKRFRAKMKDLPPDNDIVMTVRSNSSIAMTAGDFPPREGEESLNLEKLQLDATQKALGARRVRPGNPLYIRVIDPDQSKTPGKDTLVVDLQTSSGDKVSKVVLTETDNYSGEFQASVPTASAITTAYATDTEKGLNPNDAISPKQNSFWKGDALKKVGQGQSRAFTVDFNDRVPLSVLNFVSPQEGKLKEFVVQTSQDGALWISRASYPKDVLGWEGSPEMGIVVAGLNGKPIGGRLPPEWLKTFEAESTGRLARRKSVKNLGRYQGHDNSGAGSYLRFRALFFQPSMGKRIFELRDLPNDGKTVFIIDGVPSSNPEQLFRIERDFEAGLHEIQVWRYDRLSTIEKGISPSLWTLRGGSDELIPCPDDLFDISKFPPQVKTSIADLVKITNTEDQFQIDFGQNHESRAIRLLIQGDEGSAPMLGSLTMTDRDGEKRLPTDSDYRELRSNRILEVLPGDKVSVIYEDDTFIGMDSKNKVDSKGAVMGVAFNDGSISASFLKYEINNLGERELRLEALRRFRMGSDIAFVIKDVDMDVSDKRDSVKFRVKTSNGTTRELTALETGEHTGEFHGRFYPQLTESTRPAEIQITHGATITAIYRDEENLSPGIPTDRTTTIEHAKYVEPKWTGRTLSTEASIEEVSDPDHSSPSDSQSRIPKKQEIFFPKRKIISQLVSQERAESETMVNLLNSNLSFTITAPHLALSMSSEIHAYIQTESARQLANKNTEEGTSLSDSGDGASKTDVPFDLNLPGTLKITSRISSGARAIIPKGYHETIEGSSHPSHSLEEGHFAFSVPITLGTTPNRSFANRAAETLLESEIPKFLAVRPGDTIHVAYPYFEEEDFYNGEKENRIPKWYTFSTSVESHVFLDMMNSTFSDTKSRAFVGEKVYLRVVSASHDLTPGRDEVQVKLEAKSGSRSTFTLKETEQHSGIFKGIFSLTYLADPVQKDENGEVKELTAVELDGFPVLYNDQVTVSWVGKENEPPPPLTLHINSGSDGKIVPFSKKFADGSIAVSTNFTLAECFFELAKMHKTEAQNRRATKQEKEKGESLARRKMAHAKKLLMEALSTFRDDEQQAHAEYLLGNLAQEYAGMSKNDMSRKNGYSDALVRFKKVVSDFPDAEFASKAQYKIGWVYDKMSKMENMDTMETAVDEYVKLAYKYPEDDLIPKVMARIALYFVDRGKKFKDEAKAYEKKHGEGSGAGIFLKSRAEYYAAAQIYVKLGDRFPEDPLAEVAHIASGLNFMRANAFNEAVDRFKLVIENEALDGESIRAQAMFWMGYCYEKGAGAGKKDVSPALLAVQSYNRTRYEFPSTRWAKQARGRLLDPAYAEIVASEAEKREKALAAFKKKR